MARVQNAEASTMSKSVSTTMDLQAKTDIVNGKASFLDKLFPLYDEIQKRADIPKIVYYIVLGFVIFQLIAVSFWVTVNLNSKPKDIWTEIMFWWTKIAFFTDHSGTISDATLAFIIVSIFAVIFVFGVAIQMVIFKNERRFIKWTLYLTRIIIEFCPTVCMIPIGYGIGSYIDVIINKQETFAYVYLCFAILYVFIYMFDQSIQSKIFNFNVYLSKSVFVSWDPETHLTYLSISAIFPCLNFILMEFADWTQALCILSKAAFDVYMVYHFTCFPLLSVSLNAISAALFSTMCLMDIYQAVRCFVPSLSNMLVLIILVGGMIIFSIIYHYTFDFWVKKMSKKLTEGALEDFVNSHEESFGRATQGISMLLTDPAKRALYESYGLDKNRDMCMRLLRVGIAKHCPLFLDWSLVKYVAEHHPDKQMTLTICQMLSFFPAETRMMNYFFNTAISMPDLNYADRFLLYQVHRVKGLRQSSASTEITEKLLEMKNMSMDGIQTARNFWVNLPENISYLYDIRKLTISLNGMFKEAIEKWPNNIRMCEDYSMFLIEGASDFVEGLKIKNRGDMVEQGKNFVIDLPFRSLVRHYPEYLKKGILDLKGNFIVQKQTVTNKGSQSMSISLNSKGSSNNSFSSMGSVNGELDAEVEEQLGKTSFSYPRLRLAFQRSLQGRKSDNNEKLKLVSWWTIALTIICMVILYVYYYNLYVPRTANMSRQVLLNNFRFGFDCAVTVDTTIWAQGLTIKDSTGATKPLMSEQLMKDMITKVNPNRNENNLNLNHSLQEEANRWVAQGRDNLEMFMLEVVGLAIDGEDISTLMKEIYSNIIEFDFCDDNGNRIEKDGKPASKTLNDLKSISTLFFMKLRQLTMDKYKDTTKWENNKDVCEIHINAPKALAAFNELETSISDDMTKTTQKTRKQNFLLMGIMIGVYFCITEPLLFVYLFRTLRELKSLIKMMHGLNDTIKKEASQPMKNDTALQTDAFHQEARGNSIKECVFYSMLLVPVVFGCGVVVVIVLLAESHNQHFLRLNEWLFYGLMRGSYMHEAFAYTMVAMAINEGAVSPSFLSLEDSIKIARDNINTLQNYNNVLLRGNDELNPCLGESTRLDDIHIRDDCHSNVDKGEFHDTYRCSSLDRDVSMFSTFVSDILVDLNQSEFEADSLFYHMFHISNYHMIDLTFEAATILADLANTLLTTVRTQLAIFCFGGLAILILGFLVFFLLVDRLQVAFDGAMQMMLRLPPLSITQHPDLFNFLMHKKGEKTNSKMSTANSVVHLANDAIFFLNRQESIEVVNKAVPMMLGYTPEQLLGQPFSTVISAENGPKVFETFTLMRSGQSNLIVEQDCTAMTDNDQPMPVHVTILAITEGSTDVAKSFVVIVRDESKIIEARKRAENAKEAAEKLLYQILPRDIVTRLNRGESDISLVVPSATVIFIDIQKFSDYAANLAPSQIMENLSLIFATFDEIAAKYPLITKIKLIGDVYMAAAGLFNPEEAPTAHAQQTVQFALDVLTALDDINSQLDSSLQVRIGINTDGPLYAGVLGTDKPVFDIIGDTINVAARLQSTGIPGTVQISESTYEAIKDLNFYIQQRGLLELKGKGKRMAYVVRGINTGSFFARSEDGAN